MEDINKTILQDIYEIDNSLRVHEKELKNIIAKLIASRPDAMLDEEFRKKLRVQIIEKITLSQEDSTISNPLKINFNFMKKAYYILGGAAVGALAILPVVYIMGNGTGSIAPKSQGTLSVFEQKIARVSDGAFGSLSFQGQAGQRTASEVAPQGLGGGGGGVAQYNTGVAADGSAKSAMPINPGEWVSFKYVYKGDPLMLTGEKLEVLKRIKGSNNSAGIADSLKGMNFGIANLSALSNAQVQSFNIFEDKEFGYMIDVNIPEGAVNISQNWMKWPQAQCADEKCYERNRLKIEDMIADDEAIQIANAFVQKYSIALSSYGKPEVMNEWRLNYAKATGPEKENYYIPENITVLYPLVIDGKIVYDDFGNKIGLNVNVDVRNKKASGIWNLTSQNYQGSLYDTVSNSDEIMKVVENGGMYGNYDPSAPKIQEVEVGTPTLSYLRVYDYNNGLSDELLVPAYYFPILKGLENYDYFYRKAIVVPLVPEMLNTYNGGGPIRILNKAQPLSIVPPATDQPVTSPEKVAQ